MIQYWTGVIFPPVNKLDIIERHKLGQTEPESELVIDYFIESRLNYYARFALTLWFLFDKD